MLADFRNACLTKHPAGLNCHLSEGHDGEHEAMDVDEQVRWADEPEEARCSACHDSGIGHGDPDTSRCLECGPRGKSREDREDEAYERWSDARFE